MSDPGTHPLSRARFRARRADLPAYGLGLALGLALEGWARLRYVGNEQLLGQRQSEYHGNAAPALLFLALAARPLARAWAWPMRHRRALGVLAFGFSVLHTYYAFVHTLGNNLETLAFLTPERQAALWLGIVSLGLLVLLWLTSNDAAHRRLKRRWKLLHRLAVPALLLAVAHTVWMGVHYGLDPVTLASALLILLTAALLVSRSRKTRR